MRLFFDVASVEVFADGGATVLRDVFFPSEPFDRLAVYVGGGSVRFKGGTATRLEASGDAAGPVATAGC